jgi:hypothetical protein
MAYSGKTLPLRMKAGEVQIEATYRCNSILKANKLPAESTLDRAASVLYSNNLISSAEYNNLKELNLNANLAKHQWGPSFFKKFTPNTIILVQP